MNIIVKWNKIVVEFMVMVLKNEQGVEKALYFSDLPVD